jgi:hypothetical protein
VTQRSLDSRSSPGAQLDNRLFIACGLAWGAGLIHVEAAIEHIQEYVLYAVFFELLAAAQFLWGIALYRYPTRRLLSAGAVTSLMVVALWIASRTCGLPLGPSPWSPERVGVIDSAASADELVLALLVVLQLRSAGAGALVRGFGYLASAAGVCLILFSSLAATLVVHAH